MIGFPILLLYFIILPVPFSIDILDCVALQALNRLYKPKIASKVIKKAVRPSKRTNYLFKNFDKILYCFEKEFLKKAFFLRQHKLDTVLLSLLNLSSICKVEFLREQNITILINERNLKERFKKQSRSLWDKYIKSKKTLGTSFLYSEFCNSNNIPLDTLTGTFPLVFTDYRRVLHSLKLAWAFMITLISKKMDNFEFNQRDFKGHFTKSNKNHLSQIFIHTYCNLRKRGLQDESKIIKCLKNSLCYHVSSVLNQNELPEGDRFNLIPIPFRKHIDSFGEEEKVNFYFSLLQSKCLFQDVPESFVQEALVKHRDQLSSVHNGTIDLDFLRERGRIFGEKVNKLYKPHIGFHPHGRASACFSQPKGGMKSDLVYHDRLTDNLDSLKFTDRMEPLVIGLFGQPGMGKSTLLPEIISFLRKQFPDVSDQNLTYERSCNVEFWDGYKYQPIVILDDIGQSRSGKDIKEFQTLVSCNSYILPMADLSEKGKYFCSPIIICTSNLQYGQNLSLIYEKSDGIIDDASFWRRFTIPLYIENQQLYHLSQEPNWTRNENLLFQPDSFRGEGLDRGMDHSVQFYQRKTLFSEKMLSPNGDNVYKQGTWSILSKDKLSKRITITYKRKLNFHENIRKTWIQKVDDDSDQLSSKISSELYYNSCAFIRDRHFEVGHIKNFLTFPSYPPSEPLPVRVEPVIEPLKVRTITAGIAETFCLKPFAKAMHKALGLEQQFSLTQGTNNLQSSISRLYRSSKSSDFWISGDYSAATDSVSIEASKALLEGILESIDHLPTKRWALKEISPHLLIYPENSGLAPVLQKSGQLMGSLLSFPLLCLLNDCTAKKIGLKPYQYLINGDDILMRCNPELYPLWKESVDQFGLSLSLGKNYIHKNYGTVNSQLIHQGRVLFSGKQKVLDRKKRVLGECLRDLELMMGDLPQGDLLNIFKQLNREKLKLTVRSINVPVSHGGLALSWGSDPKDERDEKTRRLVYFHTLFQKIKPKRNFITLPYLSQNKFDETNISELGRSFNAVPDSKEYFEDFIGTKQLNLVRDRMKEDHYLREVFQLSSMKDLPPINFLDVVYIPVKDPEFREEIQKKIDRSFFKLFLNGNKDFSYETFKQDFINNSKGIKCQTFDSILLFSEKDIINDKLLSKISTQYRDVTFSKKKYTDNVEKLFQPKNFDLQLESDSIDFSREVDHDINNISMLFNSNDEEMDSLRALLYEEGEVILPPSCKLIGTFSELSSSLLKDSDTVVSKFETYLGFPNLLEYNFIEETGDDSDDLYL